jgi:methionyl aminopeptidase
VDSNTWRTTSVEKRELDRLSTDVYREARLAAEVHRQVRQYAEGIIKPGARLIDICEQLENMNRKLVKVPLARSRATRCVAHHDMH